MKKIVRYMQDQALQHSQDRYSGASYLSSPGKEPQQHGNHSTHHYKQQHNTHAQRRSSHPSSHSHSFPSYLSGARGPSPIPLDISRHQYAQDNILQSYDLFIPQVTPDHLHDNAHCSPSAPKYWVIYVHGGYFRDPTVTAASFNPALSQLVNPLSESFKDIRPHIAGYASINYRLSPHPAYPEDEDTTSYETRAAKWPEHLEDVIAAIKHLQSKHGFGQRYLLAGHSVGATLTLLAALRGVENGIEPPLAVLGVCGIYDFPKLHQTFPDYVHMTRNAMPGDKDVEASPARHTREEYEENWARGQKRWVVLAHSREDGLLDWRQVEGMAEVFGGVEGKEVLVDVVEIKGKHNEVFEKGTELARVVAEGVREMMGLDAQ